MEKLEVIIRNFCKTNSGKEEIDFNLFQFPESLFQQYAEKHTFNQFKGNLMEMLLEELFLGNGYRVERLGEGGQDGGCDLLIRYPQDNSIRFVLQSKNWSKNIDKYDIKKEYLKFSDNYKGQYNLNATHFCFVAWNYVRDIKNQLTSKLNIKVWDEKDVVQKLFQNYRERHPHYPSIVLEPYQETAFEKILNYWSENSRCYVEHATGTGKTYIIAKLTQYLLPKTNDKILILSPSAYINDRILKLLEETIPSKHITRTFRKDKKVFLLTYQYLMRNAGKLPLKGMFSHIIMDEVHRAGAPEWHSKGLLNVIDNETKLVGLSATMQRYFGGIDVKNFLENKCVGKLSLFEAMARGILPVGDYVYAVLDMNSKVDELKTEITNKYDRAPEKKKNLLYKLNAREIKDYSIQNIIYKYFHSGRYRKIIAFCEDIGHTIDIGALLENTFLKFCRVKTFKVHSKKTKADNKLQFGEFTYTEPSENEIYVLTAVDMLNEGIDVPGIDSVMLFRRTESPRVYFQQIGRSIRKHGIKSPLIFDCVLNYQSIDIHLKEEAEREFNNYQDALEEFGFDDIEMPKTIHISDEVQIISEIIEHIEKRLNFYPTYEEAKQAAQRLRINSASEYHNKRYKEDPRLPGYPNQVYIKKGWVDWYDFFDKKSPNLYPTYEQAKKAVRKLGLMSSYDYRERSKEDPKLPASPDRCYKNKGWVDWYDLFDKKSPNLYPTYQEAKKAVLKLGIKSQKAYYKHCKRGLRLPTYPHIFYKDSGWIDWYDIFNKKSPNLYPTYEQAKKAVRKLGIKSLSDYRKDCKEDQRLPTNPHRSYKNKGWIDWYDFLGIEASNIYPAYDEAKQAVVKLGIKFSSEYRKRFKEDPKLPSNPQQLYKNKGWIDWYDFLDRKSPSPYPTYQEAKKAVQKLDIKKQSEYKNRYKEDPRLPSAPWVYYKNIGWVDWYEFLGKERKKEGWM